MYNAVYDEKYIHFAGHISTTSDHAGLFDVQEAKSSTFVET